MGHRVRARPPKSDRRRVARCGAWSSALRRYASPGVRHPRHARRHRWRHSATPGLQSARANSGRHQLRARGVRALRVPAPRPAMADAPRAAAGWAETRAFRARSRSQRRDSRPRCHLLRPDNCRSSAWRGWCPQSANAAIRTKAARGPHHGRLHVAASTRRLGYRRFPSSTCRSRTTPRRRRAHIGGKTPTPVPW